MCIRDSATIVALVISIVNFLRGRMSGYSSDFYKKSKSLESSIVDTFDLNSMSTTQGKRMDMYMYMQSLLSEARHRLIKRKYEVLSQFIFLSVVFIFLFTVEFNEKTILGSSVTQTIEAIDKTGIPKPEISMTKELISNLVMVLYLLLVFLLWLDIRELRKLEKNVSGISLSFTNTFGKNIEQSYNTNINTLFSGK